MITIKSNGTAVPFTTSVFPDGTSQVWKLEGKPLAVGGSTYFHINFLWEDKEAEIMQLFMLLDLIHDQCLNPYIVLYMPYLPYARQDKAISNESTFALHTFASLLNSKNVNVVYSYDVHSKKAKQLINNFSNITPFDFHHWAYKQFRQDVTFYPDAGAASRYSSAINEIQLYGEKVRNQLTGDIEGYRLVNKEYFDLGNKKILIIDDICDGGATFIAASKELMKYEPKEIALCVSHGLYSKGIEQMKEAGISQFFTTNSLMKNKDGFHVYE